MASSGRWITMGIREFMVLACCIGGLHALYRSPGGFVYSVTRDFVRVCQTPMLIMPDDTPAHPYEVCMEIAELVPKAEVTVPQPRGPYTMRTSHDTPSTGLIPTGGAVRLSAAPLKAPRPA